MTNRCVLTVALLINITLHPSTAMASTNMIEPADVYVAKVVSDFAGKQLISQCGPSINGVYENIQSLPCIETTRSIEAKLAGLLADCNVNLLSLQACRIIHNVDKAIKLLVKEHNNTII